MGLVAATYTTLTHACSNNAGYNSVYYKPRFVEAEDHIVESWPLLHVRITRDVLGS